MSEEPLIFLIHIFENSYKTYSLIHKLREFYPNVLIKLIRSSDFEYSVYIHDAIDGRCSFYNGYFEKSEDVFEYFKFMPGVYAAVYIRDDLQFPVQLPFPPFLTDCGRINDITYVRKSFLNKGN